MIKSLSDYQDDFVALRHTMVDLSLLSGSPEILQTDPDYERVHEQHNLAIQNAEQNYQLVYSRLNTILSDELIEAGLSKVAPEY